MSTSSAPKITIYGERGPVPNGDSMPPNLSSFPVSNNADLYIRSMLGCAMGYPLCPFGVSVEYLRNGVNIGDVGFVTEDGTFDFSFNVCSSRSQDISINPPNLPDGFTLETEDHPTTRPQEPLPRNTRFFPQCAKIAGSDEYLCAGSEGAVLKLPEGAIQCEAIRLDPLLQLAKRRAVEWYKYMIITRGSSIQNGSLYLVTSFTKCTKWDIAVFDQSCAAPVKDSTLVSNTYQMSSTAFPVPNDTTPNQCVFLKGYKILLRQDIFDELCNTIARVAPTIWKSSLSNDNKSPLYHPLDSFNARLLDEVEFELIVKDGQLKFKFQNPDAKIAIMHDDLWCKLWRDTYGQKKYAKTFFQQYGQKVDEYCCVTLEKLSDLSCLSQGTETSVLDQPVRGAKDASNPDISIQAQQPTTPQKPHLSEAANKGKSVMEGDQNVDRLLSAQ